MTTFSSTQERCLIIVTLCVYLSPLLEQELDDVGVSVG
jgi:hypothetical protein